MLSIFLEFSHGLFQSELLLEVVFDLGDQIFLLYLVALPIVLREYLVRYMLRNEAHGVSFAVTLVHAMQRALHSAVEIDILGLCQNMVLETLLTQSVSVRCTENIIGVIIADATRVFPVVKNHW
jgi:hypothetical protein